MRFVFLCWLLCVSVSGAGEFPKIRFWALKPRGLDICVDDQPKLTQFSIEADVYKKNQKSGEIIGGVFRKHDYGQWCWKHATIVLELGDTIRYVARGVIDDVEKKNEASKIITVYDMVNDYTGAPLTTTSQRTIANLIPNTTPPISTTDLPTTPRIAAIPDGLLSIDPSPVINPVYSSYPIYDAQPVYEVQPVYDVQPVYQAAREEVVIIEQYDQTIQVDVNNTERLLEDLKNEREAQDEQIEKLKVSLAKKSREYEILADMFVRRTKGNDNYLVLKTMIGVFPREEPSVFVQDFLRERLAMCNDEFKVKSSEKINETIWFEVETYEQKLKILVTAYRLLVSSRYVVADSEEYNANATSYSPSYYPPTLPANDPYKRTSTAKGKKMNSPYRRRRLHSN